MMAAMPGSIVPLVSMTGVSSQSLMPATSMLTMNVPSMMLMNSSMLNPHQYTTAQQVSTMAPTQAAYMSIATANRDNHHQHLANGDSRSMSPSRSVTSASPPNQGCQDSTSPNLDDEKTAEYIKELQAERDCLESMQDAKVANAVKLLDQEISQLQSGLGKSGCNMYKDSVKYVDVYRERPIRLTVRVLVPVREHPKFNFVGKLLGPKGNSMKRLQEETMTKMAVLGKGSMRDKQKEEDLRLSSDPKYQHLQEDLHVEITAFAPPAEAHARIAYALTELRKYLIPDSNDEIRQEQMREMELMAIGSSSDTMGTLGVLRQTAASLTELTPQTIQSQAAAAAAALCGMNPSSMAALAMRNQTTAPTTVGQLMATTPYIQTAGNPLVRKLLPAGTGQLHPKVYSSNEEMMLEAAAAVSQSHQDVSHAESAGLSLSAEGLADAWGGSLKAPSVHFEQRSKFRQQAAPYNVRLN